MNKRSNSLYMNALKASSETFTIFVRCLKIKQK